MDDTFTDGLSVCPLSAKTWLFAGWKVMDGAARGGETRGVEKHVENRVEKHGNIHRQGARGRGCVEINRFIQGWRTAFQHFHAWKCYELIKQARRGADC